MKGALNENTVFATVAMARQASHALLIVVEGDDDHFILKDHLNHHDVVLIAGNGGKGNVLRAASLADARKVGGVRFLVDSDLDRFVSPPVQYPANVLVSTTHDVVTDLLFQSPIQVEKIIDSHSRKARRKGVQFSTSAVWAEACELAAALAPLRIVNERHGYGLNFQDFPFGKVSDLPASNSSLSEIAVSRSNTSLTATDLSGMVDAETSHKDIEIKYLFGDHDFFGALGRVLKSKGVHASSDSLVTTFLAGILCSHLTSTDWCGSLASWGERYGRKLFVCPCAT
ncbi:hypothetical protein [Leucobacter sp. VD1]|uniref:hypothetical protein n=1 Tax=Leucobacter sp. VD1 TaxID=3080381 RepID=UPI00301776AA